MRVLVVSNLYPPVAVGGYEMGCAAVVEHLRANHEVEVLTGRHARSRADPEPTVHRELPLLTADAKGALRAPFEAPAAARLARNALAQRPDLVYVWNGASIPHAALRVLADSGVPIAFRVCEYWFGGLFTADQFMRELLPDRGRPVGRRLWAAGCRAVNGLASLRLDPTAPFRAAIAWNSHALERSVPKPPFVDAVLERVIHSVPAHGDIYAGVARQPADPPEIVFLGRVSPYKGVTVAIEALALLRARYGIAATLVVVGPEEGSHGTELRALARRLGVGDFVRWRGQLAAPEAAAALATAAAMIVPSTWDEPFGVVMIEGAFARVPLVASDVGGISEGLRDEEHALLFPRGDAAAAAAALARVLREPEETAARTERAHERAQAFRLRPAAEAHERFLEDARAALSRAP